MYAIYAYIDTPNHPNGAAYMTVPWSVWYRHTWHNELVFGIHSFINLFSERDNQTSNG